MRPFLIVLIVLVMGLVLWLGPVASHPGHLKTIKNHKKLVANWLCDHPHALEKYGLYIEGCVK